MKLSNLRIQNFRSIVDTTDIRVNSLQAFVGENNAGKSNILYALNVFLTTGTAGIEQIDFNDHAFPIIISATFEDLTGFENKRLRRYLLGDKLVFEKHIILQEDKRSGKFKASAEYHGYLAEPKDWWLSIDKIIEKKGQRPKWEEIAEEFKITEFVRDANGKINKASYEAGVKNIILESDNLELDEATLGNTQALGLQSVLLDSLPSFYILPAITNYSDETDRRTTSTTFQRLMGDLAGRLIRYDRRFEEIEIVLRNLHGLLNIPINDDNKEDKRLSVLAGVESKLQALISRLMPSVSNVNLKIKLDDIGQMFARGASILINDGTLTEVLLKGHGLQRCVIFGLLQALILNQRNQFIIIKDNKPEVQKTKSIILAIEEPELYIHPQMQRLVYSVLEDFAVNDQVLYSTHSPVMVDVSAYKNIAIVKKKNANEGTKILQCSSDIFSNLPEKKAFQFYSSFGVEQNWMFFAKNIVLVEGEEDKIALIVAGRELKLFRELSEEIGYSIIVTDCKDEMKKYMKLLNAFKVPYIILHEIDGKPDDPLNAEIVSLLDCNKSISIPNRLEDIVGHKGHFSNKYSAKKYFENNENINKDLLDMATIIFSS